MNVIREDAQRLVDLKRGFNPHTYAQCVSKPTRLAAQQAERVLLLERAYRYQKVAKILAHCERMFDARGDKRRRQRCTYKGAVYSLKARNLYRIAAEI